MSRFSHLEFEGDSTPGAPAGSGARDPDPHAPIRDHAHHLSQAQRAFEQADFEGALRHYARAVEDQPRDPAGWAGQAQALVEMGDFEGARDWAARGLDLHPAHAELTAARAVALARLGQIEEALALSDAASEEHAGSAYLWLARADILMAADLPQDAAAHCLREALAASTGPAGFTEWRAGRIAAAHGRQAAAQGLFQQSIARDAGRSAAWSDLGECLVAMGNRDGAAAAFRRSLELQPGFGPARQGLIRLAGTGLGGRLSALWKRLFGS